VAVVLEILERGKVEDAHPESVRGRDWLDRVADELNGRPRQTLEWMKPAEAFDQLIATTA
jgi:hypothetical protein